LLSLGFCDATNSGQRECDLLLSMASWPLQPEPLCALRCPPKGS
jgi:hypothetical protein